MILKPSQVTVAVETSVSQTLTALEIRSLLAQLETAVWEQMTASHMVLQETVVNALVSIISIMHYLWMVRPLCGLMMTGFSEPNYLAVYMHTAGLRNWICLVVCYKKNIKTLLKTQFMSLYASIIIISNRSCDLQPITYLESGHVIEL